MIPTEQTGPGRPHREGLRVDGGSETGLSPRRPEFVSRGSRDFVTNFNSNTLFLYKPEAAVV